jgi:glutamine synthetase type III
VRGLVPGVRLSLERATRGFGALIERVMRGEPAALLGAAAGRVGESGAPLNGPTSWRLPAELLKEPVSRFSSQTGLSNAKLADVIRDYEDPASERHAAATACLESIVAGMKSYAESQGITKFAHWFSAWTGDVSYKRSSIDELSVKTLFQGEVDGSSKPSGGLRGTHHARAYTVWDSSAQPFVLDGTTLCIPALFMTHNGEAMDLKIPAKRAAESLSRSVQSFLELVQPGRYDFDRLEPGALAGPEQEYFLLPKSVADARPDLVACGRTLIGNRPAHNQQLAEHYFGRIPSDVGPYF